MVEAIAGLWHPADACLQNKGTGLSSLLAPHGGPKNRGLPNPASLSLDHVGLMTPRENWWVNLVMLEAELDHEIPIRQTPLIRQSPKWVTGNPCANWSKPCPLHALPRHIPP